MRIIIEGIYDDGDRAVEITNEDMNTANFVEIISEVEPGKVVSFSVSVNELFQAASVFEEIRRTVEPR